MATMVASRAANSHLALKRPKFDSKLKAGLAVVSNIVLLLAVNIIYALDDLLGKGQITLIPLLIFDLLSLLLIVFYGAVVTSDTIGSLVGWLVRVVSGDVRAKNVFATDPVEAESQLLCNLWIPVTLNFLLAGYLIYMSGGITGSPFGQVPIAMMLIGQSVYDAPRIDLTTQARLPQPVLFLCEVARLYAYPLCLMVGLLAGLLAAQTYAPLETAPAPSLEIAATGFVVLFASMCVTFVTRRADQLASR